MLLLNTMVGSPKGLYGEALAKKFLIGLGYKIVVQNFHCPYGEIDLIAKKNGVYHFCEVKTRWNTHHGYPEESVTKQKLQKIIKTIAYYKSVNYLHDSRNKIIIVAQIIEDGNVTYQKLIDYD